MTDIHGVLLNHGQVSLVDAEDYGWLSQWEWKLIHTGNGKPRAYRRDNTDWRHPHTIYMARAILGLGRGDPREADHLNFNTLDNRRSNLRISTADANKRRVPSKPGSSSRFIGVTWDRDRCLWRAQIRDRGVVKNLGRFSSQEQAAAARDSYVLTRSSGHTLNTDPWMR